MEARSKQTGLDIGGINAHRLEHSLENFLKNNCEDGDPKAGCELVSASVLRVNVDGSVWINAGTAIAHYGDVTFERLPTIKTKSLKKMALRELVPLVQAKGNGKLFCARSGWHLRTIYLKNESIKISSKELLAIENTLDFEMQLIGSGLSLVTGGILEIKVFGEGWVAIGVHGDPLVLPVTPDQPLYTDPHATVAWTAGLYPSLASDISLRSLIFHGGHESFQMRFEGEGFVVMQPSEDPPRFSGKKLKKLIP